MSDTLQFPNREAFRKWLSENCLSEDSVWLLFGKAGAKNGSRGWWTGSIGI